MEVKPILNQNGLQAIAHLGLRLALGVIFIVHGYGKFGSGFTGFLTNLGIPTEMQIPIALAEIIPGVLLIVGVLSRISASLISVIMVGAILYVKKPTTLVGQGGFELELILLASSLFLIASGPGKISLSEKIKRIPKFLR